MRYDSSCTSKQSIFYSLLTFFFIRGWWKYQRLTLRLLLTLWPWPLRILWPWLLWILRPWPLWTVTLGGATLRWLSTKVIILCIYVQSVIITGSINQNSCLCWSLTSQSTIFQSYRDGATASWVINQYFRGVKCLAQGHNTAVVGLEPPTSRSGVRHSTTEPRRSPQNSWTGSSNNQIPVKIMKFAGCLNKVFSFFLSLLHSVMSDHDGRCGCGTLVF